jgi:DNA-directed RNA polymerase specialized sigma24 family protein
MEEQDPVPDLVDRCRRGDATAAEALFARYADRLTRLAEEHLSRRVAAREDGEDVVLSAFRTFFRRCSAGEFRIDGAGQLWRLLARITLLKARARGRFHGADRRDAAAEAPGEAGLWLAEEAARGPGPLEAVVLADLIETLLHDLPPFYGEVLELRLQGHSRSDIALNLGLARQTIHRALDLLKQRLTRSLGEG